MTNKEKLAQAIKLIQEVKESISDDSSNEAPVKDIRVEIDENNINVFWTSNRQIELDIWYYSPEKHYEWQHVYSDYVDTIDSSDESVSIGIGEPNIWYVKLVDVHSDWESEAYFIERKKEEQPTSEYNFKVWGWWDSMYEDETFEDYPFANTLKTYADLVPKALESEAKYIIPYIGMEDGMTEYQIRKRLKYKTEAFKDQTKDRVPFFIVQDEPKFGREYQEMVIELCKEFVPHIPATFTYSGNHMWEGRAIASNIEHVHWNDYPIRDDGYPTKWGDIRTKEQFMEKHDELMNIIKSNSPDGVTFSITTQTFAQKWREDDRWEWQWAPPMDEVIFWYAEFMSKYNMVGALHYLYKRKKQDMVAIDMPGVLKNVEAVFTKIKQK